MRDLDFHLLLLLELEEVVMARLLEQVRGRDPVLGPVLALGLEQGLARLLELELEQGLAQLLELEPELEPQELVGRLVELQGLEWSR